MGISQVKVRSPFHTGYWELIALTVLLGLAFFSTLNVRPLMAPSEARYVEIAREMAESNDYITPRLNYVKYFEKPPLIYWLQASIFKTLGYNHWSMRLGSAFFALLGCLAVYLAGRKLFDRSTAWVSAIILASSLMYFTTSQINVLDTPISVLISIVLLIFLCAIRYPDSSSTRRYLLWLMYACAALAMLTKGLIGFVLPGLVIGTWIAWTNQWRLLGSVQLIAGLLIFLAITLPWHILVQVKNPEFAHFYFLEQHVYRYATMSANRYQPFWWFIPVTLGGFYPWVLFLIPAVINLFRKPFSNDSQAIGRFFFLWAILIVLFFSFSKSKLLPYVLPVMPALALLSGYYLMKQASQRTLLFVTLLLAFISGGFGVSLWLWREQASAIPQPMHSSLLLASLLLVLGALITFWLIAQKNRKQGITVLGIAHILAFILIFNLNYGHVDDRTIKSLADTVKPLLNNHTEVIAYNHYYQDLPAYLERQITIVNDFNELKFGHTQEAKTADWLITEPVFWQRWNSHELKFMIISLTELAQVKQLYPEATFITLAETPRDALVANQPLPPY